MSRSGAELALLLLGSYRTLVDAVVRELADRGYDDVRPVHDFAMRAIVAGADSASALGRSLSVSKQAAAKTIAVLVDRGYVATAPDPRDARRKRLEVTPLGHEVMREGEAVFDRLHRELAATLGADALALLEEQLRVVVGDTPVRLEAPGWVAQDL
ncbi:MarR family winged helix-turn-helix transcriptional regulator [Actinotalea solisilvae]|uniref:MarR family winged helix-turn-helix transcriptional regulator n=1 Tax=Actinotalea solisilvae TaxID=2072922 RepID=UPI0018F20D5F|nr:MarR family transcriptional regulator [Actinotalea solisilvae]